MNPEKNVVDFKDRHSSSGNHKAPIVAECRRLFQKEFMPILTRFFEKVDDELFAMSDKAVSSTIQELYFEAMRYLRRERENIERQYLNALLKGYDDFWQSQTQKRQGGSASATSLDLDEDDFSLVENETLETDLAVGTLINKGNNLFHRDLYALNKRFAKLLGCSEIGNEDNPLAPHMLGKTFAEVLRPLTLELKVKLVLFKLYENHVIGELEVVYEILNDALSENGVLPEIPRKIKKRSGGQGTNQAQQMDSADSDTPSSIPDQTAYIQAIQAMHTLISAWRSQAGLPSLANMAHEPGVVVTETEELVGALSSLQEPEQVARLTTALQQEEGANVKLVLANHLSEMHGGTRALTQVDEDVIDMIGMIFDFILEDRNLQDKIKAIIGRLQIPIIKVAILDKSFLSKKSHPARGLLNQLAHAGIALSGDEDLDQNPVFQRITETVDRILNEFTQNIEIFEELLQEFTQFMEQEGRRSERLEERTRQSVESKEHLLLAKKQVADEIARRLSGKQLSPRLKHFFSNTWKDVLLLSCLRKDRDPENWDAKLALTDSIFLTLTPPKDASECRRILQRIPGVLRALRQELEQISLDPKQVALLFKELEGVHLDLFHHEKQGLNPRLEAELREISSNLPDVDEVDISDLTDVEEGDLEEEIILMSEESIGSDSDEFVVKAKQMEVGDWLEMKDSAGKPQRIKLSWISKVTGIRIFVNRRGMKVGEYTLNGLAAELRRGNAVVIEGAKVPLMDRALASMMSTLKHPAKQPPSQEMEGAVPVLQ